ncbi:hypothetical protein AnigIFM56816_003622 [Aspergillus niger]|nr:hypothetical protein AnigIFM50267_009940 [Aspergillus niger]GKZ79433.1 hypothetical protein AnigIFM56816_003622 [Aspergillus niger]GLA17129.1 hypothetical protein AnigIFM62618_004251 [Aspergillus niger]
MKLTIPLLLLGAVSTVNGKVWKYYAKYDRMHMLTQTRSCSNDIGSFHTYRGSQCGGSSATTTATAAASTSTITLSSCILECQSTAADTPSLTKPRDCAGQDGTFHQWRGSICASSTTTSSSTSAATSTSSSSGSSGLSKGAIAGISVGSAVAGIAIISLIVFTLLRRRWKAANTYNKDSDPRNFPLHKLASASTSVA